MNVMTAFSLGKGVTLNSAEELEVALRQIGATRYHNLHPFHRLLHGGKLNKGQVQAWALNRYYYQSTIPIKDAVVISRFRDRGIRLEWRHRIEDHDGDLGTEGGIERWLKLTEGLGLDSAYVESTEGILPATRFAVDAYVRFVRDMPHTVRRSDQLVQPRELLRVFYDVTETSVEILAIIEKQEAQAWLDQEGTPSASGGPGQG